MASKKVLKPLTNKKIETLHNSRLVSQSQLQINKRVASMSNDNDSNFSGSRSILNEPSIIKHNTFAFDKNGTMDRPLPVKRIHQNKRNYPTSIRERQIGVPTKFV